MGGFTNAGFISAGSIFTLILQQCGLDEIIDIINAVFACVELIFCILICLFGYKLLKLVITINGAILGGILGAILGAIFITLNSSEFGIFFAFIMFGMLLFGFLAFKLYRLGIFLHYFLCGTLISAIFLLLFGIREFVALIVISVVLGIIIGIVALFLDKVFYIISSAFTGGFGAVDAICTILGAIETVQKSSNYGMKTYGGMNSSMYGSSQAMGIHVSTKSNEALISGALKFVLGLILAIIGTYVQFSMEKKKTVALNSNIVNQSFGNNMISNTNITQMNEQANSCGGEYVAYCPKCGAKTYDGTKYCPSCGVNLHKTYQDLANSEKEKSESSQNISTDNSNESIKMLTEQMNNIENKERNKVESTETTSEIKDKSAKIKYCAACGTQLEADAAFCLKCGSKV